MARDIEGPERGDTDDSLRTERLRTDAAIAASGGPVAARSDQVIERAREHADAVLELARSKADSELATAGLGASGHASLDRERAREDEALEDERARADSVLAVERAAQRRVLGRLLHLERSKTDANLLTERARADAQLAQRDDFLGMVSHDLRSLLCTVLMKVSQVSGTASDSPEGRQLVAHMKAIEAYAARMNSLVGDLLDVVRIGSGKLELELELVDAAAVIRQAVEAFAPIATEKGVRLDQTTPVPLLAYCEANRIHQVLANLVANAIKFTPAGGRVTVSGEAGPNELSISVLDTGIGIPSHLLEAVFERFWQDNDAPKRGLGLGLYISKCIVEAHGGAISATSTLGLGSTFVFTVPVTAGSRIERRRAAGR